MKREWFKRLLILLFLTGICPVIQAEETPGDASANVPALTEFHKVIYRIWHEAWPNKDYDLLASLLPEISKGTAAIAGAELPGILRDKKVAWEKAVKELQDIVQEYRSAAESKQDQPLLDAAEKLHAQYETLVRVIRPPLRQLEEFHSVLYMLYHYHMPGQSLPRIKASIEPLQEKMRALKTATLPARFKGREPSFTAARNELEKAVTDLSAAVSSNDLGKIEAAVETMHDRYVEVAAVLE